ncbi:hypothetical protein KUCAC02_027836 [Chaenocephalus aceratus]|nr:hypothetical protein KUCAC02_027836 [Chaenocephalus aceratus]
MKTASRAPQPCSPPLVTMRRYTPGIYPFLFPSIIGSLPPSPQRLQIQPTSSSGSTPSPAAKLMVFDCPDVGGERALDNRQLVENRVVPSRQICQHI